MARARGAGAGRGAGDAPRTASPEPSPRRRVSPTAARSAAPGEREQRGGGGVEGNVPLPVGGAGGSGGTRPRDPSIGQVSLLPLLLRCGKGVLGGGGRSVVRASLFPVTKFLLFYKLPQ